MRAALREGSIEPGQLDYINAHATSTPAGDAAEACAIGALAALRPGTAPPLLVSATKGATGHLLGAAGGVEAAIACKVLQTGNIPPTINLHNPDPACDLNYVPNTMVADAGLEAVISNSVGFGGHNAALVFKKYS